MQISLDWRNIKIISNWYKQLITPATSVIIITNEVLNSYIIM